MQWTVLGYTFDVLGRILIGIAVLFVHKHIMREHKIDQDVLKEMKREQLIGLLGIILILRGYFINMYRNMVHEAIKEKHL